MVRIRLRRGGKRGSPFYRIVVSDSTRARDGKYIESVGYYNPLKKEQLKIDMEKIEYWISRGAQLTAPVKSLIKRIRRENASKETIEKE